MPSLWRVIKRDNYQLRYQIQPWIIAWHVGDVIRDGRQPYIFIISRIDEKLSLDPEDRKKLSEGYQWRVGSRGCVLYLRKVSDIGDDEHADFIDKHFM